MKTAVQDPWKRFREKWKRCKGEIWGSRWTLKGIRAKIWGKVQSRRLVKHEDSLWDKTLAVSTERVGESCIEVDAEKASVTGRERRA